MNEQFHTDDCGISLICRCCRGPVCYRHLSRADRLSIRRELWPSELPRARSRGQRLSLAAGILTQIVRWALRFRNSRVVSPSTNS
jgi:hypothetical protein